MAKLYLARQIHTPSQPSHSHGMGAGAAREREAGGGRVSAAGRAAGGVRGAGAPLLLLRGTGQPRAHFCHALCLQVIFDVGFLF